MKPMAIIFAILGIGLHFRTLGFLFNQELSASLAMQWHIAPIANRVLVIGSFVLPFAFYGMCIAACLVKHRTWKFTLAGSLVCLLAVPYFIHVNKISSSLAKNSAIAAFFAIPSYLVKPRPDKEISDATVDAD